MVQLTLLLLVALASTTFASPFMKHRKRANGRPSFNTKADRSFFRLPTTTMPEEYDIQMVVDPTQNTFTGETKIWIRAMEQTDTIILHAYNLRFNSIVLKDESGEEISITNTTSRDDRHFLNITLNDNRTLVENERYELVINYWTRFTTYFAGMFKTSYVNENGTRRYMVATQFQATYARDAFPCYDEPSFKAIFNVHIYHPEEYEAISNMDVIPSTLPPMPDMNVTSFRTTPLMSTYLLAMVVSDLSYKSNTRDGSIIYPKEYRVYARQAAMPYVDYALDFGQRSIAFMEAYTDVEDRMPKLDNVAVPELDAGAMENWGLITYIEDVLFYEKGVSTTLDELLITTFMSHENSHFWFGNEVSPSWWDYLWLNEGFATYFENYATDKVQDGWRAMEEFVVETTQYVMIQDSYQFTHAMNNEVNSPDEVEENFDGIAYLKAGSVVRMIQHMVGEQLFQAALSSYIKSLPTGVSTPDILYEEMEKVIGNNIQITDNGTFSDVFRSWADQPGYPVVNMTSITGSTTVVVTQERFYYDAVDSSNETWWLPFTWTTSSNLSFATNNAIVISPQAKEYYISVNEDSWYIANLQQSGYYRVMYDLKNWQRLIQALSQTNHTLIHPLNKAQLLDDAFTFSNTDRLHYSITFGILNYLQRENDFIPWISAARGINTIKYLMPASKEYELYKQFIRKMVARIYNSVGFDVQENDIYVTKRMRTVAFEIACEYELPDCLRNAQRILSNEASNSTQKVDPDLEMVGYCYGVKNGPRELWDYVLSKYEEDLELDAYDYLSYLACSSDSDTIDDYLNMTLVDENSIPVTLREYVVRYVALYGGPVGVERALAFLNENFLELREKLPFGNPMGRIIQTLGSVIVTPQQIEAFDEFVVRYEDKFTGPETIAVNFSYGLIDEKNKWIQRNMLGIENWLLANA